MIVYKAVNKVNGKIYVGQTRHTLEQRKSAHIKRAKSGVNTHFYCALRKYGEDAFEWSVICTANSKSDLNLLETYYIQKYNSIECGYNMVDGGNNNVMDIKSVYEHHKEVVTSESNRKKISNGMKKAIAEGRFFTPEHRRKLSEAAKKRVYPPSEPKVSKTNKLMLTRGDTRSISCYCIDECGNKHQFHSYRDAGKWWYNNYHPFKYSECTYQRKIKQSIELGYCYYTEGGGGNKPHQIIDNPKWFKEVVDNEEVTDIS